jgi:hypothetical protein
MTMILDRAIEKAKALSASRQDEVGAMLLDMVEQDASTLRLSAAQLEEVRRRLGAERDFVPTDEMDAYFRKLAG